MSIIKSFSVGNGDMFYIDHDSDNFTIIDCCLNGDIGEEVLDEIFKIKKTKIITRFISTHPDEDHIRGIESLHDRIDILNFYCVNNKVTKKIDSDSFKKYCLLRDDSEKAFYIYEGCSRRWMNKGDTEHDSSDIDILWPVRENEDFKEALAAAADGESPNNISPIIQYSLEDSVKAIWMGDLEAEFMELIESDVSLSQVDILFAPHHGRDSGKVPASMLNTLKPKIIVIGEAPSEHLNYYGDYKTITQNSAGDIVFDCQTGKVHIFTSNKYSVDFLKDENRFMSGFYYLGTLNL